MDFTTDIDFGSIERYADNRFQLLSADIEDDTYEPYIENTEVDLTLPALPTLSGTNTLSVGTEVQPLNVEIKGSIKEVS